MSRLPIPGDDDGIWGSILNDFLEVEHNADGTLKPSGTLVTKANDADVVHVSGAETISGTKSFTASPTVPSPINPTDAATKAYVDSVSGSTVPDASTTTKGIIQLAGDLSGTANAPTIPVLAGGSTAQYFRGDKSWQTLNKTAVGLVNVDNTSDANKPISTATQTALNAKTPTTRLITAGTGLSGGGDLSADRTLSVSFGSTAGTVAQGDDSRFSAALTAVQNVNGHTGTSVVVTASDIGAVTTTGGGKESTVSSVTNNGSTTVDLVNGNVQMLTLGASTTITLSGATNGTACSLSLYLKQDATGSRTVTWPASVKWPGGAAPVLSTAATKLDLVVLETLDGGTTWYGSLAGADFR
jgi:hypothetical protein